VFACSPPAASGERSLPRISVSLTLQDANRHKEQAFIDRWVGLVDCVRVNLPFRQDLAGAQRRHRDDWLPGRFETNKSRQRVSGRVAAEVLAVWTVDPSSLSAKSSLSVTESRRVLDVGRRWIIAQFPSRVRDTYREMFDRRLRFNMARHWLVWRSGAINSSAISELLNWGRSPRPFRRIGPFSP
jgi:hypothetical protein